MKLRAWLLGLAIFLLLPSLSSTALAIYEFPICTAPGCQSDPAISGSIVVWQDTRNGNADIYGYDLSTGQEFPICTAPSYQCLPAVSGKIVVWVDARNWATTGDDIYGYDLSTGQEFPICTAPGTQWQPAISGNIVVWVDSRNYDGTSWYISGLHIYGYDLAAGREFPICTAAGGQLNPAISGNIVVWEDGRNVDTTEYDIYGYDLSTGQEFPICTAPGTQWQPAISGNIVVWEDGRNWATTDDDIYGYDLAAGREFPICTAYGSQVSVVISGNIVVWEDGPNIYGYDLATGQEFPIWTVPVDFAGFLAISENIVAWSGLSETGDWHIYSDIYGAVLDDRYNPPEIPSDPLSFQPYVAYVTTQPNLPLNGQQYLLKVVVRNHGGLAGDVTVALDEYNLAGFSMVEDWISPDPPVIIKTLPAYGEAQFLFGIRHRWEWITQPPAAWQATIDGVISCLPVGLLQQWAAAIKAAGTLGSVTEIRSIVTQIMTLLEGTYGYFRTQAPFRYLPGEGTTPGLSFDETVTLWVPDWKIAALQSSIAHSVGGSVCSMVGSSAGLPGLPLLALQGVLKYAAYEYYKIAYDPDPDYQRLPVVEPIAYPELEALPDSAGKAAALAAKAWVEVERARVQAWVRMAAAEQAGDDYWRARQAQAAHEFGELAQARLAEYQRLLAAVLGLPGGATPEQVAAFKQELQAGGLPPIEADFLLRQGWTQADIDALVESMVNLSDEWYETPKVAGDATTLGSGGAYLQKVGAYQAAQTPKLEAEGPLTYIVVSGELGRDGQFVSDVQVRLQASAPPSDAITALEYSLDSGTTWVPYDGEFVISQNGSAEVLARATAQAAGMEDPPARRVILKRPPVFPDIPVDHWAWRQVEAAYWSSVVAGYPDGTYQPTLPVTRDQMAVYISRALAGGDAGVPSGPAIPSFTDVPTTNWAYKYIEYAKAEKVVSGYPDGSYQPGLALDRAQMAVFIARAVATPTDRPDLLSYTPPLTPSFPDVTPDNDWSWAYRFVEYIADPARAVTQGYPDGKYHPEYPCTRDQMAVYVARASRLPL